MRRSALGLFACAFVLSFSIVTRAQTPGSPVVADRVAVRFVAPETGGAARPRFLTERQLGFFTRVEALGDGVPMDVDAYPERSLRTATDRLVARAMLAALLVQSGVEPTDLPRLTTEARAELADRLGGNAVLDDALQREGLDESELAAFLRDQVRALWYVDRTVQPILSVTEDSLREAFRSTVHPYRTMKYEDARPRFRRWLAATRLRAAELEFLQSARARITIASVVVPSPSSGASGAGVPGVQAPR